MVSSTAVMAHARPRPAMGMCKSEWTLTANWEVHTVAQLTVSLMAHVTVSPRSTARTSAH